MHVLSIIWGLLLKIQKIIDIIFLGLLSCVQLFLAPWTIACQAPLSLGFSQQEYQSGLTCPPPGDLCDPGIESMSPASPVLRVDSLLLSHLFSGYIAQAVLMGIKILFWKLNALYKCCVSSQWWHVSFYQQENHIRGVIWHEQNYPSRIIALVMAS